MALTEAQAAALRALSRQVGQMVELRQQRFLQAEANRRLNEAHKIAKIGSWEFDIASGETTWLPLMFRLLQFDSAKNAPTYDGLMQRYHPDDVPMHNAVVAKAMQDGLPYEFDIRAVYEDGTTHWMHSTGRGRRDRCYEPGLARPRLYAPVSETGDMAGDHVPRTWCRCAVHDPKLCLCGQLRA